jgi:hypothetical protein
MFRWVEKAETEPECSVARSRTILAEAWSAQMALDPSDELDDTGSEFALRDADRFVGYEDVRERSHFGAFLMGGVVVAGGLLAFLYYDTDNLNGRANSDLTSPGAIGRSDAPAPLPSLRLSPSTTDGGERN